MPADMNTLARIKKNADLTAKRLQLDIESVSAFSDGTYRVEYADKKKEPQQIGFTDRE